MKNIARTIIILVIIFATYSVFIKFGEHPPLEMKKKEDLQIAHEESNEAEDLNVPESGILSFIGKPAEDVKAALGDPNRIDSSAYDYDWWIYNANLNQYLQIGIENDRVVSVYGIGSEVNVSPFTLGQPLAEVFKIAPVSPSLEMEAHGNSYRFEFSEEDMNTRPSVKMGDVYIQLYIDKFDGTLSSIRALDRDTFIKQRPYEVVYRGELLSAQDVTPEKWQEIERGSEQQILDITNVIRMRHGIQALAWDEQASHVAFGHSRDMKENQYFSHESPTEGRLSDRLEKGNVSFRLAGENIAAHYIDGIAATEGWLNSQGHREALLNDEFTSLGVGVNGLFYTQNFIKK
ncbi:hypothetical protein GJU40_05880 [Bacillus lacus]|uniref:CAP domain-containing protein n=1 Tax=Metabacillus lacus TaxID=1983721 RepID=A0A7X2IXM4_9BACI|nr:CAP domain-containing protein [Metabacillus lacus]MRX71703.1 hypothetical protein [Metabacillus lacus]